MVVWYRGGNDSGTWTFQDLMGGFAPEGKPRCRRWGKPPRFCVKRQYKETPEWQGNSNYTKTRRESFGFV